MRQDGINKNAPRAIYEVIRKRFGSQCSQRESINRIKNENYTPEVLGTTTSPNVLDVNADCDFVWAAEEKSALNLDPDLTRKNCAAWLANILQISCKDLDR